MGDIESWFAEFRELHERYKKRDLKAADERVYMEAREQMARSLLIGQRLTVEAGSPARRSFRVAQGLQVDIGFASGAVRAMTQDISCGGFSVILARPPDANDRPGVTLKLPGGGEPLVTRAALASVVQRPGSARVSFAFQDLPKEAVERLETVLFDLTLARLPK